jgi:hypothetical protein
MYSSICSVSTFILLNFGQSVALAAQDIVWKFGDHTITHASMSDPGKELREIQSRIKGNQLDPASLDYAVLRYVEMHPEVAKSVIPELIELAGLLEPRRVATAEPVDHKFQMSPAGKALVAAGETAVVPIGRWLNLHFDEASNHREVLLEAMRRLKDRRRSSGTSAASTRRPPQDDGAAPQNQSPLETPSSPDRTKLVVLNPPRQEEAYGWKIITGTLLGLVVGTFIGAWSSRQKK